VDIRFLGHACFELSEGDTRVLIDPFLSGNPKAAVGPDEVDPTHIFLTHGHADHWGDVEDIAKRTGAQCVAIVELAGELSAQGVVNVADPNLGTPRPACSSGSAARPSTTWETPPSSPT
jgi:L-ascorbate metabolism protein UlaG (beta-lactamase superfamily)